MGRVDELRPLLLSCDYGGACAHFMANASLGSPLEQLAALSAHHRAAASSDDSSGSGSSCIELGPEVERKDLEELTSPALNSSARIWFYQTCAEFGYRPPSFAKCTPELFPFCAFVSENRDMTAD